MRILLCFFLTFSIFARAESIRIQIPADPESLDPAQISDVQGYQIATNLYLGLFRLNERGESVLALAESYSQKNLTFTFKIRKDAKWSDGVPVRAEQFKNAIVRTLSPETAARDASYLYSIRGAEEFHSKKGSLEGVRVVSDNLVIELKQPDASLFSVLSMPLAAPIRADLYEKNKNLWKSEYPTTGPYIISKVEIGKKISLHPSPANQNAEKQDIELFVIPDETIALNMLESERIDIISSFPYLELKRMRENNWLRTFPSATTTYLGIDQEGAISKKERQYIANAILRPELIKVLGDIDYPAKYYLPPAIQKTAPNIIFPFTSTEKVKKREITLSFASSAANKLIAEKIQNDLAKVGVSVKLEGQDWKTYLARMKDKPSDLFILGLSAPFADPISHLKNLSKNEPGNFTRYKNLEYTKLVQKLQGLANGKVRNDLVSKAEKILLEDVALVPLIFRGQVYGVNPKLSGFAPNPFRVFDFSTIKKL